MGVGKAHVKRLQGKTEDLQAGTAPQAHAPCAPAAPVGCGEGGSVQRSARAPTME